MLPIIISRILIVWSSIIMISFTFHPNYSFLKFGPNDHLIIFDIHINTMPKYYGIICISIVNSILRTLNTNILNSWIVNNVQDHTYNLKHSYAYEISITHSLYVWIDFFMYMNIILNQIDLFMIELLSELVSTVIITRYYLEAPKIPLKSQFPAAVYAPILCKNIQSPAQTSFGTLT